MMEPTKYQRIRLWAGITSIGTNLALIWGLAISSAWWASGLAGFMTTSVLLLAMAALVTITNLPFDLLTGDAVERAAGRIEGTAWDWFKDWIRGRAVTFSGLWTGMLFFAAFQQLPRSWEPFLLLIAGIVILILFLLVPAGHQSAACSTEEAFETSLKLELKTLEIKLRPVRWFDQGDAETVNGYITPRGLLSLSRTVAQWLTPREAALMTLREEYYRRSGTWIMVLIIVAVWTLLGILLTRFLPAMNAVQAGLNGAAMMTTWSFLALFVWPTLNRVWMRKADAFLASFVTADEVRDLLSKIEHLNATDISLSPAKTAVFHPIPPLQDRLSNLDQLA